MCEDYAWTQPGNITVSLSLSRLERARQYFSLFGMAQNYKYLRFPPSSFPPPNLSLNFTRRYLLEELARYRIWREERLCSVSNGPLLTGRRATFRTPGSSRYVLVKHYVAFRSTLDPLSNGFPRSMRCSGILYAAVCTFPSFTPSRINRRR